MPAPKHLTVIRSSAMGDVAMTVPVLLALVEKYDVQITMVSKSFFEPIFADIPNVHFLGIDTKNKHKGFWGLRRLANELVYLKIDAVADLHDVLRSNVIRRLLALKGYPTAKINKGRKERKALIRSKNRVFQPIKKSMQGYIEVFEQLGYSLELDKNNHLLTKASALPPYIATDKKTIGIAPFAAHIGKRYPLHLMEIVIEQLSKQYQVVLFGGPAEEIVLQDIAQKHTHCTSLVGKLSFEEDLAHISHLDLMLAMDSGNGHLAANYGVPVVTIWGVTHPYAGFQVFGQPDSHQVLPDLEQFPLIPTSIFGEYYPEGYLDCFATIAPQKIVNTVEQALKD